VTPKPVLRELASPHSAPVAWVCWSLRDHRCTVVVDALRWFDAREAGRRELGDCDAIERDKWPARRREIETLPVNGYPIRHLSSLFAAKAEATLARPVEVKIKERKA